jgi:RecG-like helicase
LPNKVEQRIARGIADVEARIWQRETLMTASYEHPERSATVVAISELIPGRSAMIEGRVTEVEDVTNGHRTFHSVVVGDDSGQIRVTFQPGHGGADIVPGQLLRVTGPARRDENNDAISMTNPSYQVVE